MLSISAASTTSTALHCTCSSTQPTRLTMRPLTHGAPACCTMERKGERLQGRLCACMPSPCQRVRLDCNMRGSTGLTNSNSIASMARRSVDYPPEWGSTHTSHLRSSPSVSSRLAPPTRPVYSISLYPHLSSVSLSSISINITVARHHHYLHHHRPRRMPPLYNHPPPPPPRPSPPCR